MGIFKKIAHTWWDLKGPMALLHQMNFIRIPFIQKHLSQNFTNNNLQGLDIGCGAGILSENMARLGFSITGIDTVSDLIEIAKKRANEQNLTIDYIFGNQGDIEERQYDFITLMEILEHVDDWEGLLQSYLKNLKPNGLIFLSTINRNFISYAKAIIGAEYLLKIVPVKTHNWNNFIQPSEIVNFFENNNITTQEILGMEYNLLTKKWFIAPKPIVNYIMVGKKI